LKLVLFAKHNWSDQGKDEIGRACSMHGEKRTAYGILVGKPEGKGQLGSPRHTWEDNIKV
jgi:hypothetical protein